MQRWLGRLEAIVRMKCSGLKFSYPHIKVYVYEGANLEKRNLLLVPKELLAIKNHAH
jgi:hypothetical protein